ncbi:892_t:CDS:2 [Rhizophagus irregularis]|nr:892_t:CDS:2 [Rhizophagus irregularis]
MTEITDEEFESFLETFIPEPDSESDNKENNINFLNKNGHNVLPSSSNNYNNMQNKDFEWLNSQKENDDVDDTSNDGINNSFEPKSSIYFISNSIAIKDFKFPFSYYFMNQIDNYKNLYYKELDIIRYNNSENINYYSELHEDFVEDFKNNLISINRNFENLQKYSELYYNDFIKIILSTFTTKKSISEEILNFVFKNLIGDKIINDLFLLHIYWWEYIDNILIQLKLIEKFPDIITKSQNDFIVYGNLDYYLFRRVINSILQNICDDKPWEQDTDDILFIINDTKKSLNFFNFDLLLISIFYSIKELSVKNNKLIILDFVNRWLKSARYNVEFISILGEFSLKYIVELYELIEEQVADSTINNIDNKFKTPLIQQTKDLINNIIDYYPKSQQDIQLIPAKAFSLALKRFIYRFLLNDSIMKILNSNNLSIYFLDFTLDLWPSDVNEELIKKLFPTCLLAIRKCDIIDVDQ